MQYTNYIQIDKAVDRLFADKCYDDGILLLESARTLFPKRLAEILSYEMVIYLFKEEYARCLDTIEESLKNGFFMNLEWELFDPIRMDERFKAAFDTNLHLRADCQAKAKMIYQVRLPEAYSPERRYPLFIACHGNMFAIESFIDWWEPATMLEQGFVVVYIQSSQVICTNGFSWTDSWKKTREDIKACYDEVTQQYSIDPDRIIVGGFSGGGIAAIEVTMAESIPVKGFIGLCAVRKPESFTRAAVENAKRRGVKGVLMHGELEDAPDEKVMINEFDTTGFPYRFINNPGIGHNFPEDFSEKLAEAIKYIMR